MSETTVPAMATTIARKALPGGIIVPKSPRGLPGKHQQPASREAQRVAAAILEVLAGVRTPTDAAAALGISVPRYYLWEQRALKGLVVACEPRPAGKMASQQHQSAVLQKEIARLRQECSRQQALVRASQRTIGLAPPPQPASKPGGKVTGKAGIKGAGKATRKRRPTVRAMKAVAALRLAPAGEDTPAVSSSSSRSRPTSSATYWRTSIRWCRSTSMPPP